MFLVSEGSKLKLLNKNILYFSIRDENGQRFVRIMICSLLSMFELGKNAFTDSPNELTYGCPLTALQINVNCIKILIRPFESHILAQNVKNGYTIMYDERF